MRGGIADRDELTLTTYNIWNDSKQAQRRYPAIAELLSARRPDIMVFQEITAAALRLFLAQPWIRDEYVRAAVSGFRKDALMSIRSWLTVGSRCASWPASQAAPAVGLIVLFQMWLQPGFKTAVIALTLYAILPVLRRWTWLAIAIELTFVFVVLMSRSQLNATYSLFAVNVSYLPVMIIGQVVWATTNKRIPLWVGGVCGGTAWALYVLADIIDVGRIDTSYNLAMAFAAICFLLGLFAEPRLKQRAVWTALSIAWAPLRGSASTPWGLARVTGRSGVACRPALTRTTLPALPTR